LQAWQRKIEVASRAFASAESQTAQRGMAGEQAAAAEMESWQVAMLCGTLATLHGCSLYDIRLQPLRHTVAASATYGSSLYGIRLQPPLQVDLRAWRDKLQRAEAEAVQAVALVATAAGAGGGKEEAEEGVEEGGEEFNSPSRAAWLPEASASFRAARGARRLSRQAVAPARPPSARRQQAAWFTTDLYHTRCYTRSLRPLLHPCYNPLDPSPPRTPQ